MRIRWHHGFLTPPNGEAEIPESRAAVARHIESVFTGLKVRPELLTFTRLPEWPPGVLQVNVHGFGPFGEVIRDAPQ